MSNEENTVSMICFTLRMVLWFGIICPDITFDTLLMVFDDEIRFKLATWLTKTEKSS